MKSKQHVIRTLLLPVTAPAAGILLAVQVVFPPAVLLLLGWAFLTLKSMENFAAALIPHLPFYALAPGWNYPFAVILLAVTFVAVTGAAAFVWQQLMPIKPIKKLSDLVITPQLTAIDRTAGDRADGMDYARKLLSYLKQLDHASDRVFCYNYSGEGAKINKQITALTKQIQDAFHFQNSPRIFSRFVCAALDMISNLFGWVIIYIAALIGFVVSGLILVVAENFLPASMFETFGGFLPLLLFLAAVTIGSAFVAYLIWAKELLNSFFACMENLYGPLICAIKGYHRQIEELIEAQDQALRPLVQNAVNIQNELKSYLLTVSDHTVSDINCFDHVIGSWDKWYNAWQGYTKSALDPLTQAQKMMYFEQAVNESTTWEDVKKTYHILTRR